MSFISRITQKRRCRVGIAPQELKLIIEELYENPESEYDATNPMYSHITEAQFKDIKKTAIEVKNIVTGFKEKPKEKIKLLQRLEKVNKSITRCSSDEIFAPHSSDEILPEPTIEEILATNGKAYLEWMESKGQKIGGRKSLAKKSRRRRRKTRRSIRK
jgi:hypothetical protein